MNGRKKGMNGGGKLENENQAAKKAYFQQAEALYLELVRDVLRVTQFKKLLGIVQGTLKAL